MRHLTSSLGSLSPRSLVSGLTCLALAFALPACDCAGEPLGARDTGVLGDAADASVGDAPPRADAPIDGSIPPGADGGATGLVCEACTLDSDCGPAFYCVALSAGGNVCLRVCERDLGECPLNFDCVDSVITPRPNPVCTPVGSRCCVDADGDDFGTGVGCDGADCDDTSDTSFPGAAELCNGVDDDCDAAVDEEVTGEGLVCSTGMAGACSSGQTDCVAMAIVCVPNASTMVELCNGIDDDCDSNVDEDDTGTGRALTRSCYDGPAGTAGMGACTAGVQTCAGGDFVSCVGSILPGTETCNAADDDCDGTVDDGNPGGSFACTTTLPGICSPGTTQCTGGSVMCIAAIAPGAMAEVCDALDNDCDGMLNEGFAGLGTACFSGLGTCRRAGVTICDPSSPAGAPICDGAPGTPSPMETCDYVDDNCNGTVDEGFRNASGVYNTVANCRACGFDCNLGWPGGAATFHVVPTCLVAGSSASCGFNCETGYIDADGVRDNGCELFPEATTIYVSTPADGGADTSTCGAWDSPCGTITGGILRATSTGRVRVRVSTGLFVENITLANGVSLLGGHNANNWVRNPGVFATTIRGADAASPAGSASDRIAIVAQNITSATELSGFTITSISAGAGGNSIAVYVRDSDNDLLIQSNSVVAGAGGSGGTGTAGSAGAGGGAGATGLPSARRACGSAATTGPAGAVNSCAGVAASGGAGGSGLNPVTASPPPATNATRSGSGAAGLSAPRGGAGGAGGYNLEGTTVGLNTQCTVYTSPIEGAPGLAGSSGVDGAGGPGAASGAGAIAGNQWRGVAGSPGAAGQTGGGGGGGGAPAGVDANNSAYCLYSATGGSGGAAGCGGTSGQGASAGGASFAIFLVFAVAPSVATMPVITGNSIRRGTGGRGGDGGTGGGGGDGGLGGAGGARLSASTSADTYAFCLFDGSPGGSGGRGGHAGGGGGGAGGVSYDIWVSRPGAASPTYGTSNTFEIPLGTNTAGTGGGGGNSSNTSIGLGTSGVVGTFGTVRVGA